MKSTIRNDLLDSMSPVTWVTQAELAARTGFPIDSVNDAVDDLIGEGRVWIRVEDGEWRFCPYREVSGHDKYLVRGVMEALKKEFGKMPSAESACQFLESRDWSLEDGRTEQDIFRALAAHLRMLTGNEVNIADWPSATLAILKIGLLR